MTTIIQHKQNHLIQTRKMQSSLKTMTNLLRIAHKKTSIIALSLIIDELDVKRF